MEERQRIDHKEKNLEEEEEETHWKEKENLEKIREKK